jgi:hypothetical protein
MKRIFFLYVFAIYFICSSIAFAYNKGSGIYDDVVVGVDDNGMLTGWLQIYRGEDKQFSCVFYLTGRIKENGEFDILSWYPGDKEPPIKGKARLTNKDAKPTLSIKMESEPSGCGQCYPGGLTEWSDFTQISSGDWKAIRIVSSEKAFFYKKPDSKTKQKAYLVKFNSLMVDDKKDEFVKAKYKNEHGTITSGWIKLDDLFSEIQ